MDRLTYSFLELSMGSASMSSGPMILLKITKY